jgi:hypothetical protein
MILTAKEIATSSPPVFRGQKVSHRHVADIDQVETARRNNWNPSLPVSDAKATHDRRFGIVGADQERRIGDDDIAPRLQSALFGGSLRRHVWDRRRGIRKWRTLC